MNNYSNNFNNNNFQPNGFPPQQSVPYQPQYSQPAQQPYSAPAARRSSLSVAAKIALWSLGCVVGATAIFACVMIWIAGVRYITGKNVSGGQSAPSYGAGSPDNNDDPSFNIMPDIPGFGGYFGGNDDNGSSTPQSGNAGLGVSIGAYTPDLGINETYSTGLLIVEINENSSFSGTDVKIYDMIVAVDGKPTETTDSLKNVLRTKAPGDKVTLTIARYENGVAKVFDVTVSLIELED